MRKGNGYINNPNSVSFKGAFTLSRRVDACHLSKVPNSMMRINCPSLPSRNPEWGGQL